MISLLHATRWRPEQARRIRQVWLERAEYPSGVEHLFAFDDDDHESREVLEVFPHVVVSPPGSCVAAWNAAAAASTGEVLVQLSDDWLPPTYWDREILRHLGDPGEPRVLAVSDGYRRDRLLCMAILTRKRYEDQGWMFCPEYLSLGSDNEFTLRAYRDGVVVEARALVFEHRHPLYVAGVDYDRTYRHQNAEERRRHGLETFLRRNPEGMEFFAPRQDTLFRDDAALILDNLRARLRQKRRES